jgi:predicted transcriptional regulator of viral defense system
MNFSFSEARQAGLTKHAIYRMRDEGRLVALGAGFYRRIDAEKAVDTDLIAVTLRAPRATLCLATALARHDLIDAIPSSLDIALPRRTRPPLTQTPPITWHFFDPQTFTVGRESLMLDAETSIGIYNPERCIVDAFRMSGLIGPDLGKEALRAWLRRRGSQPASLLALAKFFPRTERILREVLELLL